MTPRLVPLAVCATALGLAGLTQFTAQADPHAADQVTAAKHPPISASAPCRAGANIFVRLSDNTDAHGPDNVTVEVTQAEPNKRWSYDVSITSGDAGSSTGGTRRTHDAGSWTLKTSGASGHQRIKVLARQGANERCQIVLEGRVAPL